MQNEEEKEEGRQAGREVIPLTCRVAIGPNQAAQTTLELGYTFRISYAPLTCRVVLLGLEKAGLEELKLDIKGIDRTQVY